MCNMRGAYFAMINAIVLTDREVLPHIPVHQSNPEVMGSIHMLLLYNQEHMIMHGQSCVSVKD